MFLSEERRLSNQDAVIRDVVERVEAACDALAHTPAPPHADPMLVGPHTVLCIAGGRGTGKTSVLVSVADELISRERVLVLGTIYPDQLDERYPVLPVIVSSIEAALRRARPDIVEDLDADESLRFRSRRWTMSLPETLAVLSRDSLNTREWNERVFELMAAPTDAVAEFKEWVHRVLDLAGLQIAVLPVDDADIAIGKAEEVIDALRTYLTDSRIVTIMAADLSSLERRLRNIRLSQLPEMAQIDPSSGLNIFGRSYKEHVESEVAAEQRYVESLLAKVLPPSSRYYLDVLPSSERLHAAFTLPGAQTTTSIYRLVADAEAPSSPGDPGQSTSSGSLAELLQRHPDVLSTNFRTFANQYVMFRTAVSRLEAGRYDKVSEDDGDRLARGAAVAAVYESHGILSAPTTPHRLAQSRFEMELVRSLLHTNDAGSLIDHVASEFGFRLDQLSTLHEFAAFLLATTTVGGTQSSRLLYRVTSHRVQNTGLNAVVDLALDWARSRGVPLGRIFEMADNFLNSVFRPTAIPRALADRLDEAALTDLEPNIHVVAGASPRISVTADRDHLVPTFIEDTAALGRYVHRVTFMPRMQRYEQHAGEFVGLVDAMKASDVRRADLTSAFYRALGVTSIQTLFHIDAMVVELLHDGDTFADRRSPITNFTGDAGFPWVVVESMGVLGAIADILDREELLISTKIKALAYWADLPMRAVFGVLTDDDVVERQEHAKARLVSVLDQLSEMGVVRGRRRGTISVGSLLSRSDASPQALEVLEQLAADFPTLNWDRRWLAVGGFARALSETKLDPAWDGRSRPPRLWASWAKTAIRPMRARRRAATT